MSRRVLPTDVGLDVDEEQSPVDRVRPARIAEPALEQPGVALGHRLEVLEADPSLPFADQFLPVSVEAGAQVGE